MKRLWCIAAFLCMAGPIWAQFTFNPQIGVNASRLTTDPVGTEREARVGYQLGFNLRLGEGNFYFQPGVKWLRVGTALKSKSQLGSGFDFKDNVDVSSVQVPVLAGLRLINTKLLGLRANAGPALTLVTSVNDNAFGLKKEDYQSMIWGGIFGIGVDLLIITVDLNYELGLSKVFENATEAKNNVWRFEAGVKL